MTKKTEKKQNAFDIDKAYDEIQMASFFVDGFKAYVESNNLEPKSQKEFEKLLKEFGELKL